MADQTEQRVSTATELETPAEFLVKLSSELRKEDGVDVGLVEILEKYILISTPSVGTVAQAKDAIQKLASERANLVKSEMAGD